MSEKKVAETKPATDADVTEELNDEQLAKISGGTADSVADALAAPAAARDAASGLPTGKRMHKPITIT